MSVRTIPTIRYGPKVGPRHPNPLEYDTGGTNMLGLSETMPLFALELDGKM